MAALGGERAIVWPQINGLFPTSGIPGRIASARWFLVCRQLRGGELRHVETGFRLRRRRETASRVVALHIDSPGQQARSLDGGRHRLLSGRRRLHGGVVEGHPTEFPRRHRAAAAFRRRAGLRRVQHVRTGRADGVRGAGRSDDFLRPADPDAAATTGTADTGAQAARQRTPARIESTDGWPKAAASKAPASSAAAPIECLPEALRNVLNEIQTRFGGVTVVSTTHLKTDNHSPGSARANMHAACKAVDIRTTDDPKDVLAYLRSRPEVGGINTYRNRLVHFDLNPGYQAASTRTRTTQPRRTAAVRAKRPARVPATAMARQPRGIVQRELPVTPAVQ